MDLKIGVLSFQGGVIEHIKSLNKIQGVNAVAVKTIEALNSVDGLILPGGESTAIVNLLKYFGLLQPLKDRINKGMPVWGTCAGLILLAKTIEGEPSHLAVMNIIIKRNAYGNQLDSFTVNQVIPEFDAKPIPLVFIRAPWIDSVGENVKILAETQGRIIAARQDNMLVTSFHPELTNCLSVHRYFVSLVKNSVINKGK